MTPLSQPELDLFDADMRNCLGPVMGFCANCQRPVYASEYNETWDQFETCDDCFENWGDPDEFGERDYDDFDSD